MAKIKNFLIAPQRDIIKASLGGWDKLYTFPKEVSKSMRREKMSLMETDKFRH